MNGDQEFREKHAAIFEPIRAGSNSSQLEFDKKALQDSYQNHLLQLGLLENHETTDIGKLLLRQIGIAEDENWG